MEVTTGVAGPLEDVRSRAELAERLGFSMLTAEETAHEPFGRLVLAAEHTQRAELATAVAIAFARSPWITAQQAWALQRLSRGRFVLGLGTQVRGHIERRFSMPWTASPGPRLRDFVRCLRAIWRSWQDGAPPDFVSRHYQFTRMNPTHTGGRIAWPIVPVLLAAVNPYNARTAGEFGDGIMLHAFTTFRYSHEVLLPALEEGAQRAGRDPAALRVHGGGFVVTGRTEGDVATAREQARRRVSYYASTPAYAPVMSMHGWDDEAGVLRRLAREGRWDDMVTVISDAMLDEFVVAAPWDGLPDALAERYGGWATHVGVPAWPAARSEEDQVADLLARVRAIPGRGGR